MASFFHADPATISAMIQAQDACGFGFRNPLYRRALAGDIRVLEVLPGAPARLLKPFLRLSGGTVAVVCDDGGVSDGPPSFMQARRLFGWASHVMVHATGGQALHYGMAADTAASGERVLLVETNTAAEVAWMQIAAEEKDRREAKRQRPFALLLVQVPPDQPPHPIMRAGVGA